VLDAHDEPHQKLPSEPALRTKALESLLVEKGRVDQAALDALVDAFENNIGPRNGARVVAGAWMDPSFKQKLLNDGGRAIAELGFPAMQDEHLNEKCAENHRGQDVICE
jgi:nitrile hydratase